METQITHSSRMIKMMIVATPNCKKKKRKRKTLYMFDDVVLVNVRLQGGG